MTITEEEPTRLDALIYCIYYMADKIEETVPRLSPKVAASNLSAILSKSLRDLASRGKEAAQEHETEAALALAQMDEAMRRVVAENDKLKYIAQEDAKLLDEYRKALGNKQEEVARLRGATGWEISEDDRKLAFSAIANALSSYGDEDGRDGFCYSAGEAAKIGLVALLERFELRRRG